MLQNENKNKYEFVFNMKYRLFGSLRCEKYVSVYFENENVGGIRNVLFWRNWSLNCFNRIETFWEESDVTHLHEINITCRKNTKLLQKMVIVEKGRINNHRDVNKSKLLN